VCIDEDAAKAAETAATALARYDDLSSRGRPRGFTHPGVEEMRASGRLIYGDPDECIQGIRAALEYFEFDTLAAVFNWGGIPHEGVQQAMRLFAKEVIPAFG